MIRLTMLMGLATNNSILFFEYYIVLAHRGHGLNRLQGVPDVSRNCVRPIITTKPAFGDNMRPITPGIFIGIDPNFPTSMAIAGFITTTLLSLLGSNHERINQTLDERAHDFCHYPPGRTSEQVIELPSLIQTKGTSEAAAFLLTNSGCCLHDR